MKTNDPGKLEHKWTSCAGTGRNIFGGALLYGHGRPGPIKYLPIDILTQYSTTATSAEMVQLYELLRSGTEAQKQEVVEKIQEKVLHALEGRTNRSTERRGAR